MPASIAATSALLRGWRRSTPLTSPMKTGCTWRIEIMVSSNAGVCARWSDASRTASRPLHRLAHAADAPRHRAHDVGREVRHLVDHEAELALVDDRELDRLLDPRGRRARRGVDHRHEADRLVR